MRLRTAVLAAAGFGIPLALLVLLLPITWGYGGFIYQSDGNVERVVYLDPAGPGARAGLRIGDKFEPFTGMAEFELLAGPVGTRVQPRVLRDGTITPITVTFEPFQGALAAQERFNKILAC